MGIPILLELQKPDLLLVVVSDLKILWALGAVVLTVIAAFITTTVIKRKTLIPAGLRKVKSVISLPSYYSFADDDDDSDEENEDEDEDEDEDSEEEEEEYSSSEEEEAEWKDDGELDGQDLDWEDDSVVKLWEFDSSRSSISRFDSITRSFQPKSGEISAVHVSTPASVLAAEMVGGGHVAVKVWDARTAGGAPEASASATWRPERRVVGLMGKGEKVYVGDDVGKLTVVDLRNVRSTLGEIRRWSDGVMTAGERNAAMWLTLFPETG